MIELIIKAIRCIVCKIIFINHCFVEIDRKIYEIPDMESSDGFIEKHNLTEVKVKCKVCGRNKTLQKY